MKWFFAVCAVLLETIVLAELLGGAWWTWAPLFVLVAWWHSVVIGSWNFWTAVEERERSI